MGKVRLAVVSEYRSRNVFYPEGMVIEVDQVDAAFLLRDAPGCFEVEKPEPEQKEIAAPPVDKMIHKGKRTK